jgi:hypothetical protein
MREAFAEEDELHILTARRARSALIENPRSKDRARGGSGFGSLRVNHFRRIFSNSTNFL